MRAHTHTHAHTCTHMHAHTQTHLKRCVPSVANTEVQSRRMRKELHTGTTAWDTAMRILLSSRNLLKRRITRPT